MKKLLLLILLALTMTSCTYDDVVNYLLGKPSNLTEEQKQQVDDQQNDPTQVQSLTTPSTIDMEDKDKSGINPPQH